MDQLNRQLIWEKRCPAFFPFIQHDLFLLDALCPQDVNVL